jgi:hypothetical protein
MAEQNKMDCPHISLIEAGLDPERMPFVNCACYLQNMHGTPCDDASFFPHFSHISFNSLETVSAPVQHPHATRPSALSMHRSDSFSPVLSRRP